MTTLGTDKRNAWSVTPDSVDLTRRREPRPVKVTCGERKVTMDLAATALVVIDMQNAFCHPDSAGHDGPARAPIAPLQKLMPELRGVDVPVVWVNWGNRADGLNLAPMVRFPFRDDLDGGSFIVKDGFDAAIVDGLDVGNGDVMVDKYRMSGFWDTQLDSILRNLGVTTLLFAGVNLDQCVFTTLMDASFLGYDCVLLEDCAATSSPEFCTQATLWNVDRCFGFVTASGEILKALDTL
jgi:nicotinamidase-related amidase